jgi:hypothetical protein
VYNPIKNSERNKAAFEAVVVDSYMELKSTHGSHKATNYEHALSRTPGGKCSRKVRPNCSDLICDIEICARKALNKVHLAWFKLVYVYQVKYSDSIPPEIRETIEQQVGRLLIRKQIFPLNRFFSYTDLR